MQTKRTCPRPLTVSSLFANLETVVGESSPGLAQVLLGARWGFGYPAEDARSALSEYSFPLSPRPYVAMLKARTGLHVTPHATPEADALHAHLASGRPAVVAVDSYFLPYRPAFRRVHSHRTIIAKRGRRADEVWVVDSWMPVYEGPLPLADLERSRHSDVPLDAASEPVYAGVPVQGEWFSVTVPARATETDDWCRRSLVRELLDDWHSSQCDASGRHGRSGLLAFQAALPEYMAAPNCRRARTLREMSLIIRAELSSRVYLYSLLYAIARREPIPQLHRALQVYLPLLRHAEMARDILVKSLHPPSRAYDSLILTEVAFWLEADLHLAEFLTTLCAAEGEH